MKRHALASIVLLLLSAGIALAQDVRYNYDKDTDFSKFKTYKWVPIKGAQQLNGILDKQLKESMASELAKKGLTQVDEGGNADLLIGYQAAVAQEKQFTSYGSDWGYGPGWGRGWYGAGPGMSTTTGQTSTIHVGQLAVDMYDSSHHDLVWRGMVSKTIDPKASPEKQQKNLDKAVSKLLKKYPPEKKED